ncbi:MAG: phosphoribosylaminoimidazolesuccinocarboxamide synthase [Candidatus Gracilibacteria bacterium]
MTIHDVVSEGLWPASKKITDDPGLLELEKLGYRLFYIGKNADLYFVPGDIPGAIAYRSDRTSVFNIELDLEIEGKGIIQTQISHKGFDFVESKGVLTARLELPDNIPFEIALRCMAFELCKPLEIVLPDGNKTGLEFIFRKYLTGSLYKKYYLKGLDPYNLGLKPGLKEWTEFSPILFTPTTKCANDFPINHKVVRNACPEVVVTAEMIFSDAYDYCHEKLFVMPDGKFEFFVNSEGRVVMGDEALTSESSRYITLLNFQMGVYTPADKQIIRNYGELHGWEEKAKALKPGEKLKVDFPDEMKQRVLDGYNSILEIWL